MFNLFKKSILDCAFLLSLVFAPILVPHLSSCLLITSSCFSATR